MVERHDRRDDLLDGEDVLAEALVVVHEIEVVGAFAQRGQDLEFELPVTVEEALHGGRKSFNLERGGPGFRDFRYTEAYAPVYDYVTPDRPELWRRSIYRFVVRTTPHRFMSTLDCPDPANLTPARTRTTTALQALALSNNDFMLRQAQYLAERVEHEAPDLDGRIGRAFELCFQRGPDEAELRAARGLVVGQNLFMLCRMLLNANEFVHVD